MSGPSPYNALYELFGNVWLAKKEDCQQCIKNPTKKRIKIHNEKEPEHYNKKPMKIDNACQTQPLRDYSYNKVVEPSKRKAKKKIHEKCNNFKKQCLHNASFSDNHKVHKKRTSSAIGTHLKQSHVNALYKTVSDIERIFREERNLHLHSRKCLCNSCGALGVITESMKHPVDFSDDSSESEDDDDDMDDDDDYNDNDYDDDYYNALPRYNSSKKSWKIEYKDSENIKYGFPSAEGYLRLILELEKMIKRVRSLEKLAIKHNIPIKRNKIDIAFDMQTKRLNNVSSKPKQMSSSTSSSEIDKKQCGLFSIPNVIKRKFSKKRCLEVKQETKNDIKKAPTKLRSTNYKHKTSDTPLQNSMRNTYIECDKKYQSNYLDEKLQNFDLALLNEDEICELMFHLKNKGKTNQMKQKTIIPSNITRTDRNLLNEKAELQNLKSNQYHKPIHTPFKMGTSPVGLRTIREKVSQKSLRNDVTFIRRSPNYFENSTEINRTTINLFDDFLNINNVTPAEQYSETSTLQCQKNIHRDNNVGEESSNCCNINRINKSKNDREHNSKLDIIKFEPKTERDNKNASKDSLCHKSLNFSKNDWMNEMINKSIGVIEEKYSKKMKISDNAIKTKVGKTVTYSKQNEYCFFRDSLLNFKSDSKTYNPLEIGESSGLCKQLHEIEQIDSSESDFSQKSEAIASEKKNEKILPLIEKATHSRTKNNVNRNKQMMHDVSDKVKDSLMNEQLDIKKVKMGEKTINNKNQFKCGPETQLLRSELRLQNENSKSKVHIEPITKQDERFATFIDKNIFEKPTIKEMAIDNTQKNANKKLAENDNIYRKFSQQINNIPDSHFIIKNRTSQIKVNRESKSSQTCEVNKNIVINNIYKRKENKATQVTELNNGKENIVFFKKHKGTKPIRKSENKSTITDEIFNIKDKENLQRNIVENKSSNKKCNEVKKLQMFEVNKNSVKKKNSLKAKENTGIQVTDIKRGRENIIEEIHECPLSFIFNNKKDVSQVKKKSILKTYKRAINESPLKLDKKNSIVINKFKKHVNLNIVQKVSSSIIHDIFNRTTDHNAALTKVFKRKSRNITNEKNKIKYSKIPIPISQMKKVIKSNIVNNPKTVSKIPLYLNKAQNKTNSDNKINMKRHQKNNFNQTHNTILLHSNVDNTSTLKLTKKNEIRNSQDTLVIGETIYKKCTIPKSLLTKKKNHSKIPVLQRINNKKQQNEGCNKSIISKSLDDNNLVINDKKATIYPVNSNNDLSSTFAQNIKLYPAFISTHSLSKTRKQEDNNERLQVDSDMGNDNNSLIEKLENKIDTNIKDDVKVLPVNNDTLNNYNSEMEKIEHKINSNSSNETKLLPVDSDILNSYNSQIERVERKINTDSTVKPKILSTESNILNSYNSQIEKVERKLLTESTDDDTNSNYQITESIVMPNDITNEKSFYLTPPYAIKTYESSCTFSEGSSGAIFIYKSKCQLGTDRSMIDSELDTHISDSVYTSTSDLSPSNKKKKWKWLKTFGSKFKSFLSVHTPKSSTLDSLLKDGSSSCNVKTENCNGKPLKKKINKDSIKKFCKKKWNNKQKASTLSFTLTLKKKHINSSILLN